MDAIVANFRTLRFETEEYLIGSVEYPSTRGGLTFGWQSPSQHPVFDHPDYHMWMEQVAKYPDDELLKGVFADWLEERGEIEMAVNLRGW